MDQNRSDLAICDYRWLNHYGFDPLDVPTNYRGLSRWGLQKIG